MATLVHDRAHDPIVIAAPRHAAGAGTLGRLTALLALWRGRIAEREALAGFGWREMKDLALSESEIQREIAKPFWRA